VTTVEILFLILGFVAGVVLCAVLFIVAAVKHGRQGPVIDDGIADAKATFDHAVRIDANNARWSPAQLAVLADAVREAAADDAERERREGRGRG
jgi:hypothetical protein